MDREEFRRLARNDDTGYKSIGFKLASNATVLFKGSFKRIKGTEFIGSSDNDMVYFMKYHNMYFNILIANLEDYTEESYQKLLKTLIIRRKLRDIDLEFK